MRVMRTPGIWWIQNTRFPMHVASWVNLTKITTARRRRSTWNAPSTRICRLKEWRTPNGTVLQGPSSVVQNLNILSRATGTTGMNVTILGPILQSTVLTTKARELGDTITLNQWRIAPEGLMLKVVAGGVVEWSKLPGFVISENWIISLGLVQLKKADRLVTPPLTFAKIPKSSARVKSLLNWSGSLVCFIGSRAYRVITSVAGTISQSYTDLLTEGCLTAVLSSMQLAV